MVVYQHLVVLRSKFKSNESDGPAPRLSGTSFSGDQHVRNHHQCHSAQRLEITFSCWGEIFSTIPSEIEDEYQATIFTNHSQ